MMLQKQRADHPHHAAIHLVRSLKCCKDCSISDQRNYIEIHELEYRKNILAEQLRQIKNKVQSISALQQQIQDLQELIIRFKTQNQQVQQQGLKQIQIAVEERKKHENQEINQIVIQIQTEIELNNQLKRDMENLMERVKYLNRINNQLVYNFCNY